MFASRGLKGRERYKVYPTLRCYVCKLITRAICRGYIRDEFHAWEFRQVSDLRHTIILDGMHQPLPQDFPEYCVVKHPQGVHEFRVDTQSYFRSRNASASYFAGLFDWTLMLIFPILGAVAWQMVCLFQYTPVRLSAEILFRLVTGP